MAAVYKARHLKMNRIVALKVLTPPADSEDTHAFEARFQREGKTLAQLDHPNIVTLYDFDQVPETGEFYLAMEYIDGPRFSDLVKKRPLKPLRAVQLILQVCRGLRYAHRKGVVHRDLKPSNILIRTLDDGSEQVKVVDFGLVKLQKDDQSITRTGLVLGSPHCMSPEQVRGQPVDHRADIYAIGVLLFRVLAGSYPFHGTNSAATMIAHLNTPIPEFDAVAPGHHVPKALEETVRTCLAKAPHDRFPDVQALMDALAASVDLPPDALHSVSVSRPDLETSAGEPSHTVSLVAPSAVARRRDGYASRALWIVLAGLFLLVLLLGTLGIGAILGGLIGTSASSLSRTPAPPAEVETELPSPSPEAPASTDEPTGEADEGPAPDEQPRVLDTAVPSPAPEAAPTPAPTPRPPASPPAPRVPEETEEETPDGYMGMPDDLFD